ncbi:pro-resilin [Daphnia magna]|uniref:pro-resilin n=1 Tax=Daphnia magna TaxID=35525 RepID=UPI001E1BC502|nr:pro-resilin [Daphnia magna]
MNKSIILVIGCLAVAAAADYYMESQILETTETPVDVTDEPTSSPDSYVDDDLSAKAYSFFYKVKHEESENDYSHAESSDGKVVKGKYQVQLPDGRQQTVQYVADANGYVAQVMYDGEAQYPEFKPARTSRISSY